MKQVSQEKTVLEGTRGSLGTFAGVFTPSVLTILGIILFLRLDYVVGNAGLGRALIILGLANVISVLTSFSLAAVATNLKVKGGGDYYLISRTLGVQFGGAIGIVLFLAQSVSIAFYAIGFGVAVRGLLPETAVFPPSVTAAIAVACLFVLAWLGTDVATRFQYLVMTVLACALVSFFVGGASRWDTATLVRNWEPVASGAGFWLLFAVFFPAVTGFTQGVSMSGDLKDAGKSLPLGTFLAVGVSILVYFGVAVVLAASMPADELAGGDMAMKRVAHTAVFIDAGVIAATLSSAMASFLGAPRILQSMARDRIFPFLMPFAKGHGRKANPRRGVLLAAAIAFATIILGNLNAVAQVVTMFFLISYGLLNYATYYEAQAASPSFRPRFRWFDRRLSFLGFLACFGAMLAIDVAAGAVAMAALFAVYQYLKRTAGPARWADSRRSYHLQSVREHLMAAHAEPEHPRDWRPQLIALSNDPERRAQLLHFAAWIEGGSGFTTAVRILEGEGLKMLKAREEAEAKLKADIEALGLKAFSLVIVSPKLQVGIHTLVQSFGIGPLKANTVLLNWLEDLPKGLLGLSRELRFGTNLRAAFRLGCNLVILDAKEEAWAALDTLPAKQRRIDVWWWNDSSSRLMLLLAYLMTRSRAWADAKLRVLDAGGALDPAASRENLRQLLEDARIEAAPEVIPEANADAIPEHSADAALVFVPFRLRGNQLTGPFGGPLEKFLPQLPIVAMVLAAMDIDLDAEPEEGTAGAAAAAHDALADAVKRAEEAGKNAQKAAETAEKKMEVLKSAIASGRPEDEAQQAKTEAFEAKEQASQAARKAAKAAAKAEAAARAAKEESSLDNYQNES